MDEERRAKRSRFDDKQTTEKRRSASPERPKVQTPPVSDAAAAARKKAAEAAARISAMLKTKKASSPAVKPQPPSASPAPRPPPDDVNEHGLYVRDIEVNDLRNRYLVVKESTLEEIKSKTGADIEVRGKYYPDKSMATERDPPMFLHISSSTKTKMEAAVGMANKLINSELGPLVDERRFRKKEEFERDEFGRRKWPEEKVYVDMAPIRGFHLRASIVGTGGSNVKFVQSETRTRIQIKGQGSGFADVTTGEETDEQMHLHITGPDAAEVHRAKTMVEDLIAAVRVKYEDFKKNGPSDGDERGRDDSPAQQYGAYAPPQPAYPGSTGTAGGYDYSSAPPGSSQYPPPPPPSAAIAPPFSYSSAPPPPPSLSAPGMAGTNYGPTAMNGGYSTPGYGNLPPPPPGSSLSQAPPPPPPGANAYSRSSEEYDPYAPGRN